MVTLGWAITPWGDARHSWYVVSLSPMVQRAKGHMKVTEMTASRVRGNRDRDARMGAIAIMQSHEIACDSQLNRQRSRETTRADRGRPSGPEEWRGVPQGPGNAAERAIAAYYDDRWEFSCRELGEHALA